MNALDLIPSPYRVAAVLALSAALVAGGAGIGWGLNGWRLGARVAEVKAQAAEERAAAVGAALTQARAAAAQRDELAERLHTIDGSYSAQLQKAHDENQTLRDSVARGARVVRVNGATCPGHVPEAPARGGVDSGTSAVLSADAGQTVYDLRAGILAAEGKLGACQDAVRVLSGTPR